MKTDTVFKRAFNDALDLVSKLEEGARCRPRTHSAPGSASAARRSARSRALSERKASSAASGRNRVAAVGRRRCSVSRRPRRFRRPTQVEKRFMEWMLRDNTRPAR